MFAHSQTLSTESVTSPWIINASRRKTNRVYKAWKNKDSVESVESLVILTVFLLVVLTLIHLFILTTGYIFPYIPIVGMMAWLYLMRSSILHHYIKKNRRKVMATKDDFSYQVLFEYMYLKATSEEVEASSRIRQIIDDYFVSTSNFDRAIAARRHDREALEAMLVEKANSVAGQIKSATEDHRRAQTTRTMKLA